MTGKVGTEIWPIVFLIIQQVLLSEELFLQSYFSFIHCYMLRILTDNRFFLSPCWMAIEWMDLDWVNMNALIHLDELNQAIWGEEQAPVVFKSSLGNSAAEVV